MSVHKAGAPESPFRADILKGRVVLITGGATSHVGGRVIQNFRRRFVYFMQ
jgi:hypothetical protein